MRKLAGAVLVLALGACSSTAREPLAVDDLLAGDGTVAEAGTTGDPTAVVPSGDGTATGVDGSGPAATGNGSSTRPGGTVGAPSVSGVAGVATDAGGAGTIAIGIGFPANLGATYAAVGATNLTGSDPWSTFIQPVVDHLNANGGIAGRQIAPVYHETDPANGTFAAQAQAACSHFTEDEPVFAVVGMIVEPSLIDCLRERRTPFLAESMMVLDDTTWAPNRGFMYQPFAIRTERLAGTWVDTLVELGYFEGMGGLGVLRADEPNHERFARDHLRPALARHGVTVDEEVALRSPGSVGEAGDLFAGAGNAALRFRSAGVTHVILVPSGGALPYVFMQGAESQGYRPRYALNSLEVPAFVAPNAPAEQLHGTLGIGWLPASDIHYTEVAHGVNPAEDLCFELTQRNGDEAKRYCEGLWFLRDALARAPSLSPEGLLAGAESLGTSFRSPWTFATVFGPGRYDGAAVVRPLAFVDECACFRYSGEPRAIG